MCALMAIVFLIVFSATNGQTANTQLLSLGEKTEVYTTAGHIVSGKLEPNSPNSFGGEFATAINPEAGTFVHLSPSDYDVLAWTLMIGIPLLFILAIAAQSYAAVVTPGLTLLTAMLFLGSGIGERLGEVLPVEAGIGLSVGLIGVAILHKWRPVAVRRTPDHIPDAAGEPAQDTFSYTS